MYLNAWEVLLVLLFAKTRKKCPRGVAVYLNNYLR
jgi:sensor domain CHASE-containing protein